MLQKQWETFLARKSMILSTLLKKGLKGIVVNRGRSSLHEGSLEITTILNLFVKKL